MVEARIEILLFFPHIENRNKMGHFCFICQPEVLKKYVKKYNNYFRLISFFTYMHQPLKRKCKRVNLVVVLKLNGQQKIQNQADLHLRGGNIKYMIYCRVLYKTLTSSTWIATVAEQLQHLQATCSANYKLC